MRVSPDTSVIRHGWSFYPSLLADGALMVGIDVAEVRVPEAFGIKLCIAAGL